MHPMAWKASGHVDGFADPMVDCKKCKKRFRVDELDPEYENTGKAPTHHTADPKCGGELTAVRKFNLMFESHLGPLAESASKVYLRPETAQGIFVNFANVINSTRIKVPFGIAQIGKSFRNEINPRNFTFRSREFEQMELEFFCKPGSDEEWFARWVETRRAWYAELGLKAEKLRLAAHPEGEALALLEGHHRRGIPLPVRMGRAGGESPTRTDFDLRQHQRGMRTVGKWDGGALENVTMMDEDP